MAKTRAEIQKAYRERKKLNDPNFLVREQMRQSKARIPTSALPKRKQQIKRDKNKRYCKKYYVKKKATRTGGTVELDTQVDEVSSSADVVTPSTAAIPTASTSIILNTPISNRRTRLHSDHNYFMRLDFDGNVRAARKLETKRRRSKCLVKANNKIVHLKKCLQRANRRKKMWQKRAERSKFKSNPVSKLNLTPKSKTKLELREAGVSPSKLPLKIVKKLTLANVVFEEVKHATVENQQQRHSAIIHKVVSGKIIKKYRLQTSLMKTCNLTRRGIKTDSKKLTSSSRFRASRFKQIVDEFFNDDEVSRMMPGKKDFTKINKSKHQSRILNDYLSNIFLMFSTKNPMIQMSFSTFCRLRPRHVRLTKFLSRNACLCARHQNMALKLKVLKSARVVTDINPEYISENEILQALHSLNDEVINYDEWRRADGTDGRKRMKIVSLQVTKEEFKNVVTKEIKEFMDHVKRVRTQFIANERLKKNLPTGECVVQMDFAENYVCNSMDEIQSAYWTNASVTLHPVVVWSNDCQSEEKLKVNSYVFVSNVGHHNTAAVFTILSKLVPRIKQDIDGLKKIHYWTDSPTSQYRNKTIFHIVENHNKFFPDITCSWNYFESGHGKGPCDGIGGCAKRMASEAVKQQKVQIQDADDFFRWAVKTQQKIEYFQYTNSEYETSVQTVLSWSKEVVTIRGTLQVHWVSLRKKVLRFYKTSCYCQDCISDELETCENSQQAEITSQTEACPNVEVDANVPVQVPKYNINDWLAIEYDSEWYIGKVLAVETDECEVTFMQKVKGKFKWPGNEDRLWVPFSDILCSIPEPTATGRTQRLYELPANIVRMIDVKHDRI